MNPEAHRARQAKYYRKHREDIRVRQAKYRQEHRGEAALYRQEHHKELSAYHTQYRQEHRIKMRLQESKWRQQNPLKKREHTARRYALKNSVATSPIDFATIIARDKNRCGICHKQVRPKDLHLDHIIPLSQGGPHAEYNIQVTHRTCNLIKGGNGKLPSQIRLPL